MHAPESCSGHASKHAFHAGVGSQTVFLGKAPSTNTAAITSPKAQPSFLQLLSNSTTITLTGPVTAVKQHDHTYWVCDCCQTARQPHLLGL